MLHYFFTDDLFNVTYKSIMVESSNIHQLWLSAENIGGINNGDTMSSWPDLTDLSNDLFQAINDSKPTYHTNVING
ncbi:MAG: hypothetical protein OMM_11233, partial [Candidatus Magnetoglobus multicellularis str. Araruama]